MKKILLLFTVLVATAFAQVKIDLIDLDWPSQGASQLFRRNAANNGFEFVTASPQVTLAGDASGNATFTNLGNATLTLTLANSGVTAAAYGSATTAPSITFDAKGRATAASAVTITPAWASVTGKPSAIDGSTTQTANTFFAGPASGSAAVPAFRLLTQADTQPVTAAARNALSPRGGIYFDGTSGSRVSTTLTNQALATDPWSVTVGFTVPSSSPAAVHGLFSLSSSATDGTQAGAVTGYIDTGNTFRARIYGATTGDYNEVSLSLAAWAGKPARLKLTRSGTTVALYLNGAAQTVGTASAGTAPTWAASVTSTFFNVGYLAASTPFVGTIYGATLYNLALTAAEAQEIYELGGTVPARFAWASQVPYFSADFSTANWAVGGTTSVSGGKLNLGNTTTYGPAGSGIVAGGRYSFTVTVDSISAGSLQYWRGDGYYTFATGTGTVTTAFNAGASYGTTALQLLSGGTAVLDDYSIRRFGAIVHLPMTEQLGYQVRDASSNRLHADRTASGTSWTAPLQSGRQTLTYTFAHSAISATAATTTAFILPPNTVLREVQLNRTAAFDASTTLDIGITGNATKFVTATNVAATGFTQVASSSLVPESATAATTVFVKKNQATTTGSVTLNIVIEAVGSPTQ